jgi:hypothetical protein
MAAPVDLILLRGLIPDMPLRQGAVLNARVLDARTVVLEGVRLAAEMPEGVEPGSRLRVQVKEASSERLHLQILETLAPQAPTPPQAAAVPLAAYALALPGGVTARIFLDEEEELQQSGAAAERSVTVRYDSPTLGRMDVSLAAGATASARIAVAAGEPAERVRAAADVLADALGRALGRDAQVTVTPRRETFDASA